MNQAKPTAVLREALAESLAQRAMTVVSIVLIAATCVSVLFTAGRTEAAQRNVLASIDADGTRSIIVRAQVDNALDTSLLARLNVLDGVSWVGGFGAARDAHNSAFEGGNAVAVRDVYSTDLRPLRISSSPREGVSRVAASTQAADQLGLSDGSGAIEESETGRVDAVTATFASPAYLSFLEPMVVEPRGIPAQPKSVSVLVVIARSPSLVAPLASAIKPLLGVRKPTDVTLTTSETLAQLRGLVRAQLGLFGNNLVIIVMTICLALVATVQSVFVMLRRRSFGRRRALGATKTVIVSILVAQSAFTSALGAALGCGASVLALFIARDPLPGWDFVLAVAILTTLIGTTASVLPGVIASRRDPLRELRIA